MDSCAIIHAGINHQKSKEAKGCIVASKISFLSLHQLFHALGGGLGASTAAALSGRTGAGVGGTSAVALGAASLVDNLHVSRLRGNLLGAVVLAATSAGTVTGGARAGASVTSTRA